MWSLDALDSRQTGSSDVFFLLSSHLVFFPFLNFLHNKFCGKKMNFFTSYGCCKQELNYFNIIGFMCAESWGRIIWVSVVSCLIRKFMVLVVWHFWQAQRSIALLISIDTKCITNHGKPVWFGLYCFLALILLIWFEAYTSQNVLLLDFVSLILRTHMLAT